MKTASLNDKLYEITEFQQTPYARRRDAAFDEHNPRARILEVLPIKSGILYWTLYGFLFQDQLGSAFKTDYWLRPLDKYMKAYWGQPIEDVTIEPKGLVYPFRLDFPQWHPTVLKISGVTEDKIQFFSDAEIIGDEELIASYIRHVDYIGDMVFLSPVEKDEPGKPDSRARVLPKILSDNHRLRLSYDVRRFDCNHLEVAVDTNDHKSVWLMYSDVWHPFWKATVNGRNTPVYKANLAYKAVKLAPGINRVHFYFKSNFVSLFYTFVGINSLAWLVIIFCLAGRIAIKNHKTPAGGAPVGLPM